MGNTCSADDIDPAELQKFEVVEFEEPLRAGWHVASIEDVEANLMSARLVVLRENEWIICKLRDGSMKGSGYGFAIDVNYNKGWRYKLITKRNLSQESLVSEKEDVNTQNNSPPKKKKRRKKVKKPVHPSPENVESLKEEASVDQSLPEKPLDERDPDSVNDDRPVPKKRKIKTKEKENIDVIEDVAQNLNNDSSGEKDNNAPQPVLIRSQPDASPTVDKQNEPVAKTKKIKKKRSRTSLDDKLIVRTDSRDGTSLEPSEAINNNSNNDNNNSNNNNNNNNNNNSDDNKDNKNNDDDSDTDSIPELETISSLPNPTRPQESQSPTQYRSSKVKKKSTPEVEDQNSPLKRNAKTKKKKNRSSADIEETYAQPHSKDGVNKPLDKSSSELDETSPLPIRIRPQKNSNAPQPILIRSFGHESLPVKENENPSQHKRHSEKTKRVSLDNRQLTKENDSAVKAKEKRPLSTPSTRSTTPNRTRSIKPPIKSRNSSSFSIETPKNTSPRRSLSSQSEQRDSRTSRKLSSAYSPVSSIEKSSSIPTTPETVPKNSRTRARSESFPSEASAIPRSSSENSEEETGNVWTRRGSTQGKNSHPKEQSNAKREPRSPDKKVRTHKPMRESFYDGHINPRTKDMWKEEKETRFPDKTSSPEGRHITVSERPKSSRSSEKIPLDVQNDSTNKPLSQLEKQEILKSRLSRLAKEKEDDKKQAAKERPKTSIARRNTEDTRENGKDFHIRPKTSRPKTSNHTKREEFDGRPKTTSHGKLMISPPKIRHWSNEELTGTEEQDPRVKRWRVNGLKLNDKFESFRLGKKKVGPQEKLDQEEPSTVPPSMPALYRYSSESDVQNEWKVYKNKKIFSDGGEEESRGERKTKNSNNEPQRFVKYWPPDIDSISSGNQSGVNVGSLFQTIKR